MVIQDDSLVTSMQNTSRQSSFVNMHAILLKSPNGIIILDGNPSLNQEMVEIICAEELYDSKESLNCFHFPISRYPENYLSIWKALSELEPAT